MGKTTGQINQNSWLPLVSGTDTYNTRTYLTDVSAVNDSAITRRYNVNKQIIFSGGTGNDYDYLSNYSHPTQHNINSSATLADGNSKNNNWGSRYSCFVAPEECKLLKVYGWINSTLVGAKDEQLVLSIWKKDSTANGTAATRITLLSQTAHIFPATSATNYVEQIIDDPPDADVTIEKFDSIIVSVRRVSGEEYARTVTWYLNFEMVFEETASLTPTITVTKTTEELLTPTVMTSRSGQGHSVLSSPNKNNQSGLNNVEMTEGQT